MSGLVFAAVVVIVLAALAGGYVWGWLNGSARAEHAPQKCRETLTVTEQAARRWQRRAGQLEAEVKELRRAQAEHAVAETATVKMLLEELDQAAGVVDLVAVGREVANVIDLRRDLEGAPAI